MNSWAFWWTTTTNCSQTGINWLEIKSNPILARKSWGMLGEIRWYAQWTFDLTKMFENITPEILQQLDDCLTIGQSKQASQQLDLQQQHFDISWLILSVQFNSIQFNSPNKCIFFGQQQMNCCAVLETAVFVLEVASSSRFGNWAPVSWCGVLEIVESVVMWDVFFQKLSSFRTHRFWNDVLKFSWNSDLVDLWSTESWVEWHDTWWFFKESRWSTVVAMGSVTAFDPCSSYTLCVLDTTMTHVWSQILMVCNKWFILKTRGAPKVVTSSYNASKDPQKRVKIHGDDSKDNKIVKMLQKLSRQYLIPEDHASMSPPSRRSQNFAWMTPTVLAGGAPVSRVGEKTIAGHGKKTRTELWPWFACSLA